MSDFVWYLCRLLGLTPKPRVSGKKGYLSARQHETPQNIYCGPQGMIWQLAKSNSSTDGVGSVRVQPYQQNPSLFKTQVRSSWENSLESSEQSFVVWGKFDTLLWVFPHLSVNFVKLNKSLRPLTESKYSEQTQVKQKLRRDIILLGEGKPIHNADLNTKATIYVKEEEE